MLDNYINSWLTSFWLDRNLQHSWMIPKKRSDGTMAIRDDLSWHFPVLSWIMYLSWVEENYFKSNGHYDL